ncbi:Wzy polymerase domain-containing protein [Pseudomonas resinovorans]|uniref:Wzy polymerase domain-containing protein n=1 Tax=Metapseudomonas resinovorans TaxID=53412 RepID=A0ABT4Y041_METRE|nr:O-antigen ligase family protein [Pseudomonas resinovorans]MDA8482035.1 Wzy polymerase domain-containing protein [Pseudomonas resinovorans]
MSFFKSAALFSGLVFVLSWLVPNHYYPWSSYYNDFVAFLALSAAGVAGLPFVLRVGGATIFVVVLSFVPVIQYFFDVIFFWGDALIVACYLLAFGYSIALGRTLRSGYGFQVFESVAWVFLVGSLMSAFIALFQLVGIGKSIWIVDLPPGGRPFANLAQPNNLATLISCGLVSLLYLVEKKRVLPVLATFFAVGLVVGLVLTQSRTPWVGAIILLVWWLLKCKQGDLKTRFGTLFIGVFGYAVAVLSFPDIAQFFGWRAAALYERLESVERLEIWRQMAQAVITGPLWGYGWNQVGAAQLEATIGVPVAMQIEHSHNLVLDILIWNGPLLGSAILLIGMVWLGGLAKDARGTASVLGLLLVGIVLLHGMLEFPLEYAYFLLPVGLVLGMVEAERGDRDFLKLPRLGGGVFIVASLAFMAWIWQEYRVVESDHRLMRFENARIGEVRAEQSAPDVLLLTQLKEFLRFARTQATPDMDERKLEWMRNVAYRYPFPPCIFRYALALALNERAEQAREELLRLRLLHGEGAYQEARLSIDAMVEQYPQLAAISH